MLTACNDDAPQEISPSPTDAPIVATFEVWYADVHLTEALSQLVDAYQVTQPQVTLNLTQHDAATFLESLQSAIRNGAGPDLILAETPLIGALYADGQLSTLDTLLIRAESGLSDTQLNGGQINGDLYAVPLVADVPRLFLRDAASSEEPFSPSEILRLGNDQALLVTADIVATTAWIDAASPAEVTRGHAENYFETMLALQDAANVTLGDVGDTALDGYVGLYAARPSEFVVTDGVRLSATEDGEVAGWALTTAWAASINISASDLNDAHDFLLFAASSQNLVRVAQQAGYVPLTSVTGYIYSPTDPFLTVGAPRWNTALGAVLSGAVSPATAADNLYAP